MTLEKGEAIVIDAKSEKMEILAFIVGVGLMSLLTFTAVAPYICVMLSHQCQSIPDSMQRDLAQTHNTIQNLAFMLFGFLFGASMSANGNGKDKNIETSLNIINKAQDALAPVSGASNPDDMIPVAPGETKTVIGTEKE